MGGPEGWGARRVGGPEGWGPKISRFFPLPPPFRSFCVSLWVFFRGILVVFEASGPEMCTFGVLGLSCETPAELFARTVSQRTTLKGIFLALQSFVQGYDCAFEVLFPQLQSCLFSSRNGIFARWVIVFLPPVLGCLHGPKGFCFSDSHLTFWLLLPCSSLCGDSTALQIRSLQFLCKLLGTRHASPHQPKAVPICRPQCGQC